MQLRSRNALKRDAIEESIEDLMESQAEWRFYSALTWAPDPLAAAMRCERLESLRAKIDQLSPQMRHCVHLRLYQDLKYREIAAIMHLSIETVKAHLHQAQQRLKETFTERPDSDEGAL